MSSASRWRAGSTVGRMDVTTSASNWWLMAATHLNTWLRWKQISKSLQSCLQRALQLLANHATGHSPLVFTLRAISLLSVSTWCLIFTAQPNTCWAFSSCFHPQSNKPTVHQCLVLDIYCPTKWQLSSFFVTCQSQILFVETRSTRLCSLHTKVNGPE